MIQEDGIASGAYMATILCNNEHNEYTLTDLGVGWGGTGRRGARVGIVWDTNAVEDLVMERNKAAGKTRKLEKGGDYGQAVLDTQELALQAFGQEAFDILELSGGGTICSLAGTPWDILLTYERLLADLAEPAWSDYGMGGDDHHYDYWPGGMRMAESICTDIEDLVGVWGAKLDEVQRKLKGIREDGTDVEDGDELGDDGARDLQALRMLHDNLVRGISFCSRVDHEGRRVVTRPRACLLRVYDICHDRYIKDSVSTGHSENAAEAEEFWEESRSRYENNYAVREAQRKGE